MFGAGKKALGAWDVRCYVMAGNTARSMGLGSSLCNIPVGFTGTFSFKSEKLMA